MKKKKKKTNLYPITFNNSKKIGITFKLGATNIYYGYFELLYHT